MNRLTCYNRWDKILESMFQWDLNREIHIYGVEIDATLSYEIHFSNRRMRTAIVVEPTLAGESGEMTHFIVEVPAEFLEVPEAINVYVYSQNNTTGEMLTVGDLRIPVIPRQMPVDYEAPEDDGVVYVANGLVVHNGKLYLARNGNRIGDGVTVAHDASGGCILYADGYYNGHELIGNAEEET